MRYRLLFAVSLLTAGHWGHAQSQYILAGQTVGTISVTPTPAIILSGQAVYSATGGGSAQQKLLDIDSDGVNDMLIIASGSAGSAGRYPRHTADITVLSSNVELYANPPTNPFGYSCIGLANGDTLQPVMHRRNAAGVLGSWSSASTLNPLYGTYIQNPQLLSGIDNGANGQSSQGDWLDLQVHYVGFRLRASPAAPWRYGWLGVQTINNANPITITILSYALATTALSLTSAQAAGWQLYPTSVADQLTLEPPTSGGAGQLTVHDLCGRPVRQATLSGSRQQLNLAGLVAGCYLLRIDTQAGHFTQRIVKQ